MWRTDPEALGKQPDFLGDFHPVVEDLITLTDQDGEGISVWTLPREGVRDTQSLRAFLAAFRVQMLFPIELPTILEAYRHAAKNQIRELVSLDQSLHGGPMTIEIARASQRVGRYQLRRLRPLHDQRLVQRYLRAVERGEAHGWHTLIYGITLHLYSLPLRQGMTHYARKTLRGLIGSASKPLGLTHEDETELLIENLDPLPARLEALLTEQAEAGWQTY